MAIKLGNTLLNKIYLGSTKINKAYLGSLEVFSTAKFISLWETTSANETIELPLINDAFLEGFIDWGDGSPLVANSVANRSHVYASSGIHEVKINGLVGSFNFRSVNTSRQKILNITNWGTFEAKEQVSFYNSPNLDISATDDLVIDSFDCTDLFRSCTSLIGNNSFANYTIKPTDAFGMFLGVHSFNQSLNIDGSICTSFESAFRANSFNQPLVNLVNTSCTNMRQMFTSAFDFDQDLSSWNTANVTLGTSMFFNATSFKGTGIGSWNVTKMADKSSMFRAATSMVEDLSNWDFSQTTNMNLFMLSKTNADYSTSNMDALLNRLDDSTYGLNFGSMVNVNISFGSIDYTSAGATALASLISKGFVIAIGNEV